jgi:hypothetical protein
VVEDEPRSARRGDASEAEDGAGCADDAIKAMGSKLADILDGLGVDVAPQLSFVTRRQRVALDETLGQPDDAKFEAAAGFHVRTRASGDLDAAAADVDDDRDIAGEADAVHRGLMDQARFLGAGDDPRPYSGLIDDGLKEFAAVLRLPRCARRDGDDFVHAVRVGEPPELGEHRERGVHRLGRERPPVEPAGPQADHFLLPVDDLEREVRADLDHDHVDGVRADVDGGDTHRPVLTIMVVYRRTPFYIMPTLRRYDLLNPRLERFTRMLHGLVDGDVRALHRTRVASRRLREILPVLELDPDVARRLGRRLRKVTERLGVVRELDVLSSLIEELHESGRHD